MIQPLAEALAAAECAMAPQCHDTSDLCYEALKWELGFDGSEINKIRTLTANVRIPTRKNPKKKKHWKVITIRGCYYCVGKSAKLETEVLLYEHVPSSRTKSAGRFASSRMLTPCRT